jgi:AcrR family transcriptional regulator
VGLDRETVIEAAAQLADADGYATLTIAAVAARLGVRPPSLYAHVESLDALRRELELRYFVGIAAAGADVDLSGPADEALLALCRSRLAYTLAHPGLAEAAHRFAGDDPEIWAAVRTGTAPVATVLRSFGLDEEEVEHWLRSIGAYVQGFAAMRRGGMMLLPVDPDVSFELMVRSIAATRAHADRPRPPQGDGGGRVPAWWPAAGEP